MAIALRGTPQNSAVTQTQNGADVTITFDVAPQEGDVVLVFGGHGASETTIDAPGSGYTEVFSNTGVKPIGGVWYKVMGASPDTDVLCSGGGHVSDGVGYGACVLSGVDNSNVLDVTALNVAGTTPAQPNSPAITTVTDGAWVFSIGLNSSPDSGPVSPVGYSAFFGGYGNDTVDFSSYGSYKVIPTAGLETPATYTFWSSDEWYAISVAFRPGAFVPAEGGKSRTGPGLTFGMMGKMGA